MKETILFAQGSFFCFSKIESNSRFHFVELVPGSLISHSVRNLEISEPVSPEQVSPSIFDIDSKVVKSKLFTGNIKLYLS
jgi:hypothetical protein